MDHLSMAPLHCREPKLRRIANAARMGHKLKRWTLEIQWGVADAAASLTDQLLRGHEGNGQQCFLPASHLLLFAVQLTGSVRTRGRRLTYLVSRSVVGSQSPRQIKGPTTCAWPGRLPSLSEEPPQEMTNRAFLLRSSSER